MTDGVGAVGAIMVASTPDGIGTTQVSICDLKATHPKHILIDKAKTLAARKK